MFTKKQKLVTIVTALTLGCGFTFGLTPAFADSNKASVSTAPIYHFSQEDSFLKEREGSQHSE